MKKIFKYFFTYCLIIYLSVILIIVSVLGAKGNFSSRDTYEKNLKEEININETAETKEAIRILGEDFTIKDIDTGKIRIVEENEFLLGTVGLEMSPLSPMEALKAQVVVARTYYHYLKGTSQNDWDFTFSSLNHTIYEDEDYFKDLWGDNFTEYRNLISKAIEETNGDVITYEKDLACTVFCAMSNGTTLNSGEVWQDDLPYLISVASPYDVLSTTYETTTTFSADEVKKIVEENFQDGVLDFSLDYNNWFTNIEYGTGGSVLSTNICGYTVTGTEIRSAFGLRSTTFDIKYENGDFQFKTKGYGHGVGMSQTGAIAMANAGATYDEILTWYYSGTELQSYA